MVPTLSYMNVSISIVLVNPRRACAARVTALGLSFRLSVCLLLPLRATRRPKSDTNGFSTTAHISPSRAFPLSHCALISTRRHTVYGVCLLTFYSIMFIHAVFPEGRKKKASVTHNLTAPSDRSPSPALPCKHFPFSFVHIFLTATLQSHSMVCGC